MLGLDEMKEMKMVVMINRSWAGNRAAGPTSTHRNLRDEKAEDSKEGQISNMH